MVGFYKGVYMKNTNKYSLAEEIANAITHGIGTLLSAAALALLVVYACFFGDVWHIVSFSIYGATLVILYLASTLYHSIQNDKAKKILKIFDHASIYLLIAGTYTPVTLIALRSQNGILAWTIFGIIWGFALVGIILKAFFTGRFKLISTLCYLIMGWIIVIAMNPLVHAVSTSAITWFVIGGLSYTVGAVFYMIKKIPFNHAIFHLFVLGGSICHFFAILFYFLPLK